ncbi:hypothetical protein [Plasmodium yoelii yoelii]|uniref:Uncharacterized protein n=1 Tax=Plasmodium yoelii yoelii TaxID=73239 RepID=Q7RMM0_PLAYO|nr:hypothetical protein [Plasmodium yoelii yoelii]
MYIFLHPFPISTTMDTGVCMHMNIYIL